MPGPVFPLAGRFHAIRDRFRLCKKPFTPRVPVRFACVSRTCLFPGHLIARKTRVASRGMAFARVAVRPSLFPQSFNSQPAVNTTADPIDRHKQITLLFLKYASVLRARPTADHAKSLARDLEPLGLTFVKSARALSVRGDLLPEPFLTAFGQLNAPRFCEEDREPVPIEEIQQIVEDELGKKITRAFASFHPKPARFSGAGQIHHAVLHGGRHVLVRIQRPHIRQRIVKDLDSLAEIAAFMDHPTGRELHHRFSRVIDRLRVSLMRELDYRREASALTELREKLDSYPSLVIPDVIHEFSSARVLTTEFIDGSEIWEVPSRDSASGRQLAEQLTGSYLDQMLLIGHVHPEPHLENLLLTGDGKLVLTEATGTIRISASSRSLLNFLLTAIAARDAVSTCEAALRLGHHSGRDAQIDRAALLPAVRGAVQCDSLSERLAGVARAASSAGCPLPGEISAIADLFNHLATVTLAICPRFDVEGFIHEHLRQQVIETEQNTVPFHESSAA